MHPPLTSQSTAKIDRCCLGRVVGQGLDRLWIATQTRDGCNVDDAPVLARDHAEFADLLTEQEIATHIEVHHLVPGLQRMVLGRSTPGGTRVVDQNVHMAQPAHRHLGQPGDIGRISAVSSHHIGLDAARAQVGCGLLQVLEFSRGQEYLGTGFTQSLGQLQPQPTRAAGDQGGFALEVEQLLNGA